MAVSYSLSRPLMSEGFCAMVDSRVLLHIFPLGESFLRGGNFTNGRFDFVSGMLPPLFLSFPNVSYILSVVIIVQHPLLCIWPSIHSLLDPS